MRQPPASSAGVQRAAHQGAGGQQGSPEEQDLPPPPTEEGKFVCVCLYVFLPTDTYIRAIRRYNDVIIIKKCKRNDIINFLLVWGVAARFECQWV